MNATPSHAGPVVARRDFSADRRLLRIAALALPVGAASTGAAWVLLHLIRMFTKLYFFRTLSSRSDLVQTSSALHDEEERPERFAGAAATGRRREDGRA